MNMTSTKNGAPHFPVTAHRDQLFGNITYAQHGDDLMLLNIFHLLGIEKPSYIDLGAHHPFTISNTALLYQRRSRGVNVEANPNLFGDFLMYRPEDKNLNFGVGLERTTMMFYMYSDTSGRNTFSLDEVASLEGVLKVKQTIPVEVYTLDSIIMSHCNGRYPDLLLCDIEGLDYDVLQQARFDFQNGPKVVVVETRRAHTRKMERMMNTKSYSLLCRMGENLFFLDYASAKKVL